MSDEYGEASDWVDNECEKCGNSVYLNEQYIGLVLCSNCMDEVFPE